MPDGGAAIGGKPSELPIHNAHRNETIRATHADVGQMMAAGPRAMLDSSRSLTLDDSQPVDAWMKVRNGAKARR